jgi:hypothetical protein
LLDQAELMAASGMLLPMINFDIAPETKEGDDNPGVSFRLGSFFLQAILSYQGRSWIIF